MKPLHPGVTPRPRLLAILFLAACTTLRGQQLPLKTYSTTDGLPRNTINRIVRDSHGFLWFCTGEGLSRFDGYTFTNYGVEQGIPDRDVRDLIETRSGEYWIATHNGLAQFNPNAPPDNSAQERKRSGKGPEPGSRFVTYRTDWNPQARHVMALLEDRNGTIWCGTDAGLCQLKKAGGHWRLQVVDLGVPVTAQANAVTALLQDKDGALWIGTWDGLFRRWPDGGLERYTNRNGLPGREKEVRALLEDRSGRLWVGTRDGLFLLVPQPDPRRSIVARAFTMKQGLPSNWINSLLQSSDGRILVGTADGLAELSPAPGAEGWPLRAYRTLRTGADTLAEDLEGNLWMSTQIGAMRLARNGFTTYGAEEGFGIGGITSIFEDHAGKLCVINKLPEKVHERVQGRFILHRFDGGRFESVPFNLPPAITYLGWGWNQIGFQDHAGEWWLATGLGLCRYPQVSRVEELAHTPPRAVYSSGNGLGGDVVFRTYEDSRGDVWAAGGDERGDFLTRWERASQTFHVMVPPPVRPDGCGVTAFGEDRVGNLWMGCYWHDLARYRDGRFTFFTPADGLPDGSIFSLHLDHLGRLWIATTRGGLARIDDPGAERPRFVKFPGVEGVSNTDVECITEDQWGRIYVCTGHGVYRLDPETGHTKRYTAADGLEGDPIVAFRDRSGALWFGSGQGLSRFVPELEGPEAGARPPIRITALRVAGLPYPVSELGETRLAGLVLEPNQNDIQFDFASLKFGVGEVLRYQFRLEGSDQDWSPPADQRSVNFARLAPGKYLFQVRALNSEGMLSAEPASVSFRVLAPVWRRAWFLAIACLLVAVTLYSLYRYRVARLVELERVRTRIATDLHDDIGGSLSQIAILSELARRKIENSDSQVVGPLSEIANVSREVVDAMSDIVWAINPKHDRLSNLAYRMRRFAGDILGACNIHLEFRAPGADLRVGADLRRQIFLIFKEAVTNIARHSGSTQAGVHFDVVGENLLLRVTDNGKGFDPASSTDGNGLFNIRKRAADLGGTAELESIPGRGTTLTVRLPLT